MKISNKTRCHLLKFSIITLVGSFFLLSQTFLRAFFHDSKKVMIDINVYNESWIEFFLIMVMLPCVTYFMVWFYRKVLPLVKEGKI